jgi:hypothetical protein
MSVHGGHAADDPGDEYDESSASSGPEEAHEHQQDKAEQGAAQGGKGRVE